MSEERRQALVRVGLNAINLAPDQVPFDFFSDCPHHVIVPEVAAAARDATDATDHGRLDELLGELYGPVHFATTSKGRAAEYALVHALQWRRPVVATHGLFSTTGRALAQCDAQMIKVPTTGAGTSDIDVGALRAVMAERAVDAVYLEVANNGHYGWPLREQNLAEVRELCTARGAKLLIDATRLFCNAALLGESWASARRMLALADAFTVSLGKELAIPLGAIVGSTDRELIGRARLFCFEQGSTLEPPWGAVVAAGLRHLIAHSDALAIREAKTKAFARHLEAAGVPVATPIGGHAVFIELRSRGEGVGPMLSLFAQLYTVAGARGQIGTFHGRKMLRLALPLYTFSDTALAAAAAGIAEFIRVETDAPVLRVIPGQDEVVPYFRRLELAD